MFGPKADSSTEYKDEDEEMSPSEEEEEDPMEDLS